MERHDRPVITLFWGDGSINARSIREQAELLGLTEGSRVQLSGNAARHARVRRIERRDAVRLIDGAGHVANGHVIAIAKDEITVAIEAVVHVPRPGLLEVIVPVADRDRMLLAAEKCVELQVTAWRPAHFIRSRSVSPRGEGPKFREKVRARMESALEQSGGAWMPAIEEETEGVDAFRSAPAEWSRLLLDPNGEPLPDLVTSVPTVIAVGPEGGLEQQEFDVAEECGWVSAALGNTTLRFETAVIAAAAVIRATQLTQRSS